MALAGLIHGMPSLRERLEEVMAAMQWQHADLMRASGQSSSVVSQWLGKGSKEIKSIGALEAAIYLERATGYSALWLAKGQGPKFASGKPLPAAHTAQEPAAPWENPAGTLYALRELLRRVPADMRRPFGDVLSGWAESGGQDDRTAALLALLGASEKRQTRAA